MSDDDSRLMALAGAVADAETIDWTSVEANATQEESTIIRQLRVLADVASVHRSTPVEADAPIHPGGTWGGLEIRRELGHGSFATVYLAWDPSLEREVALKVLHADATTDRFTSVIREGRLLARINHPNVVRVFKIEQYNASIGLTMEF